MIAAAPSFFCPPGEPTVAQTTTDVRELAEWIVNRDRTRPIVVLTVRNKEHDPFFHPDDVLPLVGGAGDVVAIRQVSKSKLTVELSRQLPDGMSVYNGAARIYWPIDLAGSHPSQHPLVLADGDDATPAEKRARLAGRWRQPPHGLRLERVAAPMIPPRNGTPVPVRPRPVRPIAPATQTSQAPAAAAPPTVRPRPVRPPATNPDPQMPAPPAAPTPPAPGPPAALETAKAKRTVGPGEDELRLEITRAWLAMLPDPADRNRFGLQAYRLHRELAAQLEIHEPARAAVAAAAARVVSGYAWTQVSPVPQRVEQDGVPIVRDGDHAVGWRYPLPGEDRFLFYWQPASGPAVLARIGALDYTELPDGAAAPKRHHGDTDAGTVKQPVPAPGDRVDAVDAALKAQGIKKERLAAKVTREAPSAAAPATEGAPAPKDLKVAAKKPATPPARRGSAHPRSLDIADDVLLDALRKAGTPLTSRELRDALGIEPTVPGHHVTRMLNRALASGVIEKTGNRQGSRYAPA